MDQSLLLLIFRWMHIGSAIVAVGGSVFMRFVLMPAAKQLPDAEHVALRGRVLKTWKMFLHTAILLFLISGFYNYLVVTGPQHRGDKIYNMVIGIKILLAFVVFFLAIALTGRSNWSEMFRKDASRWLAINILIAAIIVAMSGYLRSRPPTVPQRGEAVAEPII
jgi:uncharacterized membrane protein